MSVRTRLQKPPVQVEIITIDESEEEEDLLPEGNEILEDGDESESDDDNLSIYEDALTAMDNQGYGNGTYRDCLDSSRSRVGSQRVPRYLHTRRGSGLPQKAAKDWESGFFGRNGAGRGSHR